MSSVKTKLKSPTASSGTMSAASNVKVSSNKVSGTAASTPSIKTSATKSSSAAANKPKTPTSSAAVTKSMAKLKVSRKDDEDGHEDSANNSNANHAANVHGNGLPSAASGSITAAQAANARRRLSIAQADNTAAAVLDGTADPKTIAAASKVNQARRRLSIMGGADGQATQLDGVEDSNKDVKVAQGAAGSSSSSSTALRRPWARYSTLSKVGYVPFNPNKVNQDRFCDVTSFTGVEEKAIFGVFDGHGAVGHEVSSYVSSELPKHFQRQPNLETNPHEAITKAFIECNTKLASSSIDCTFSGTTAIVVYLAGTKLYCCNAGDSRAVLGEVQTQTNGNQKLIAVALSSDHKPERPDEKRRILDSRGRVEACKGVNGEDIGPARVWLLHQDVPGLAMTRSFGDLIAASVGVIARPDILEHELTDQDKFMILASDGVWEFISSQEAVEIVAQGKTPEEACRLLVDEAVKRWHAEEEVVDDITCVIVYFNN